MMTGYSGTSHTSAVHHYYICNNRKKKLCKKKNVQKDFIEKLVISECRKLLTPENIERISREVVAASQKDQDMTNVKRLSKQLTDIERKRKNLMSAIMECDSDLIRKTLYEQIPLLEKEKSDTELQLTLEKAKQVKLTVSEVRFFLNALRKGDPDSIKYQKALISVLVNAVYLYDDKITLISILETMPSRLTLHFWRKSNNKQIPFLWRIGSFMNNSAPPLDVYPNPTLRGERYLSKQKDTPYRNGRECFLCI